MVSRSGFTTWEILIWFLQHFALITYVRAPWPLLFRQMTNWISYFLMAMSSVDYRARFFFTVSVVPLAFTVLAHLSFRSLWFLFWFFALLVALNLLFMAILISQFFPLEKDWNLVPVGVVMLLLCITVAVVARRARILRWYRGMRGSVGVGLAATGRSFSEATSIDRGGSAFTVDEQAFEAGRQASVDETLAGRVDSSDYFGGAGGPPPVRVASERAALSEASQPPAPPALAMSVSKVWWFRARDSTELERYVKLALLAACFFSLVVGLALTLRGDAFSSNLWGPMRPLALALCGLGLAICVVIAVVWSLALRSRRVGQLVERGLKIWRRDAAVVSMFAVSVWFMPVVFCCMQSWGCETMTCPPGHIFVNKDLRMDGRSLRDVFSSGPVCVKCEYDAQCPGPIAAGLCTDFAADRLRLTADPSLSCPRHVFISATPASVVVLVGTIAYQMFSSVHLMRSSVAILKGIDTTEVPLPLGHGSHLSLPIWARIRLAAAMVAPGSAALCKGVLFGQFKQARLSQGITGVLCAGFSALVQRPIPALSLLLAVHLWEILFLTTQTVYLRLVDQWLSITIEVALASLCATGIGVTVAPESRLAEAFVYVALAAVVVLPAVGVRLALVRAKKIDALVARAIGGDETVQTSLVFDRLRMSLVLRDLAKAHYHAREAEVAERRKAAMPASLASTHPEYQAIAKRLVPDKLVDSVAHANTRLGKLETDYLARYFTATSFWAFAAVTILALGVVRANQTGLFLSQEPLPFMPTLGSGQLLDYAAYGSFSEMTENCCCRPFPGGTFLYPVAEEWTCLNSFIKLRGRVAKLRGKEAARFDFDSPNNSDIHSGLDIRPLCARTFSPGFCLAPSLDTSEKRRFPYPIQRQFTADQCPIPANSTARTEQKPSTFSLMRLW